jgi:hypothetical protein
MGVTEKPLMLIVKYVKIKEMEKITFFTMLFIMMFSGIICIDIDDNTNKKKESVAIITLLYNKESSLLPPPPPPPKDIPLEKLKLPGIEEEYKSEKSIFKAKYAIAEECTNEKIDIDVLSNFPNSIKHILAKNQEYELKCYIDDLDLSDSEGKTIPVISEPNLKKIDEIKNNYNVLGVVYYSKIRFNENLDKAILVFGAARHGLDSHETVYGLEKIDGKWNIIATKTLTFS